MQQACSVTSCRWMSPLPGPSGRSSEWTAATLGSRDSRRISRIDRCVSRIDRSIRDIRESRFSVYLSHKDFEKRVFVAVFLTSGINNISFICHTKVRVCRSGIDIQWEKTQAFCESHQIVSSISPTWMGTVEPKNPCLIRGQLHAASITDTNHFWLFSRFRLYRHWFLQENIRLAAFFKIY